MTRFALIIVLLLPATAAAQNACYVRPSAYALPTQQFYQPQVQQQTYHVPQYQQQACYPLQAYFPITVYQAGYDTERLAIADLAVQRYVQATVGAGVKAGYGSDALLSQTPQALAQGNRTATAAGPGSQTAQPITGNVLASKCSVCHGKNAPEGGIVLDGSQSISAAQFHRAFQIFGQGVRVPEKMQSLVNGMQQQDKGQIFSELAQLVQGGVVGNPGEQPPPVPSQERQEPMRLP